VKQDNKGWRQEEGLVIGMDLGDKESQVCVLGADHEIRHEVRVRTTSPALQAFFASVPKTLVVLEAGTHSPWVSRLLEGLGWGVIVADPRRLKLISDSDGKNDRADARTLARVAACMAGAVAYRAASQCRSPEGFDGDPVAGATGRSADQAVV